MNKKKRLRYKTLNPRLYCKFHITFQMHGKKILKLLQKIFSWLPLATLIDHKVLIVHGGISDSTDLDAIARVDRHKVGETQSINESVDLTLE